MNTSFSIKDCRLIDIPTFADERGVISVLDKELPFEVKRIFWLHHILYGTEIMISLHGSFVVDLDDTNEKTSILLNDPTKGLIIMPGIWFRTHSYVDEGVSLVLADQEYQRGRYTYDYKEYQYFRKI